MDELIRAKAKNIVNNQDMKDEFTIEQRLYLASVIENAIYSFINENNLK